jgi:hypothetical protein
MWSSLHEWERADIRRKIKVKAPPRGVKYAKTLKGEVAATRKIKGDETRILIGVSIEYRSIDEALAYDFEVACPISYKRSFDEGAFSDIDGLVTLNCIG